MSIILVVSFGCVSSLSSVVVKISVLFLCLLSIDDNLTRSNEVVSTCSESMNANSFAKGTNTMTTSWAPINLNSQLPPTAPVKEQLPLNVAVDVNGFNGIEESKHIGDVAEAWDTPEAQNAVLSHGEVMRLVASQRQDSLGAPETNTTSNRTLKNMDRQDNVTLTSSSSSMSSTSMSSSSETNDKPKEKMLIDENQRTSKLRSGSCSSSSMTSQPSVVHLSSQPLTVEVYQEVKPQIKLETADTGPSESISTSSSSPSQLESPNRTELPVASPCLSNRTIEPPVPFSDGRLQPSPDAIYFPYLSKIRNLSDNSSTNPLYVSTESRPSRSRQGKSYLPILSDSISESNMSPISSLRPSIEMGSSNLSKRDPFAMPSRSPTPRSSVDAAKPLEVNQSPSPPKNKESVPVIARPKLVERTPPQLNNHTGVHVDSSLLLRHGYTPYRGSSREPPSARRLDPPMKVAQPKLPPPPTKSNHEPTSTVLVLAGNQPKPVEEPLIVAEYFVPLADVSSFKIIETKLVFLPLHF